MPPERFPPDPGWFRIRETAPGIFVIREPGHGNAFLVCGTRRAALVDTGLGLASIRAAVSRITSLPVSVLNTHWHFDHIGGNREFDSPAISEQEAELAARPLSNILLRPLYLEPCIQSGLSFPRGFDPDRYEIAGPVPDRFLVEGDRIDLGGRSLTVLATPGHTRGSLSFLDDAQGALFCGDLVYDGTLYAHFTDSDSGAYLASLDRLDGLGKAVRLVCCGHNSPVLGPEIIIRARDLIRLVLAGKTQPEPEPGWGGPVVRHSAGGLALLTPGPGSRGIDLLGLERSDG